MQINIWGLASLKLCCFIQSHNDALDDHRRIRMDEYKRDYRKLETRYCEKHPKLVYSIACSKCGCVFCADCLGRIENCSDGKLFFCARLEGKYEAGL